MSTTPKPAPGGWIPVSALQHYAYCPRQSALIHLERVFEENVFTLRGRSVHDRVHESRGHWKKGTRIELGLPIWSESLGLIGQADLVEFRGDEIEPVEYKAGKMSKKRWLRADEVQVCAQAMCLEEMFDAPVSQGTIYYASSRRRKTIDIGLDLRRYTLETLASVRDMMKEPRLPQAVADARCRDCSLREYCVPEVPRIEVGLASYLQEMEL